jgi:hypothetical protein
VRECVVYGRVWQGWDRRVVTTVLVVMSDGTDCKCDVLQDLKGEELARVSQGTCEVRWIATKETQNSRGMTAQRAK